MEKQNLQELLNELRQIAAEKDLDLSRDIGRLEKKLIGKIDEETYAWSKVQAARHSNRPGAVEYIRAIFDDFQELHGDRYYGDDPAIVGGIARIGSQAFTVIGHQKGSNFKENNYRNFGMPNPEGYRKAHRLAKQAEKFHRPIVTFIDTPGAYPGMGAEERGIGEAIAKNLRDFSVLRVPIICFVVGEGGSGGALGIGVGDKLYMLQNSVYSVITPEGFASILLRDASQAKKAAGMMKMTPRDLVKLGIIHDVIPEDPEGAHVNINLSAEIMKDIILRDVSDLLKKDSEALIRYRSKKIRQVGVVKGDKDRVSGRNLLHVFSRIWGDAKKD